MKNALLRVFLTFLTLHIFHIKTCISIHVTYIVESESFCDIKSSNLSVNLETLSNYINNTNSGQIEDHCITFDVIPVCQMEALNHEFSNSSTEFLVLIRENSTGVLTLPLWTFGVTIPVLTTSTPLDKTEVKDRNTVLSVAHDTDTIGDAMYVIAKKNGWSYVQVIIQSSDYFKAVLQSFQKSRKSPYICALKIYEVDEHITNRTVDRILSKLEYEKDTRGVLLMMEESVLQYFMNTTWRHTFYFMSLYEEEYIIQKYRNETLGWIFIPRYKPHSSAQFTVEDVENTIPTSLLKDIHRVTSYIHGNLKNINSSSCSFELKDPCIQKLMLSNMKLDNNKVYVLNTQLEKEREPHLKKVGVMENGIYKESAAIRFYDKYQTMLPHSPPSNSLPFREVCRKHIQFPTLESKEDADIYIIGILPVHGPANTPTGCGDLVPIFVPFTEAFAFAVNYVNMNLKILSKLRLGFLFIDSCEVPQRLIYQMDYLYTDLFLRGRLSRSKIIGAVGVPYSGEFESVSPYFSSRVLSCISIGATSSAFSDKDLHPYFMRMVPSNKEEALAIIGLLNYIGIKHIGMVYTDDAFGMDLAKSLIKFTNENNIKTLYLLRIESSYMDNKDRLEYVIDNFILKNKEYTQAVVSLTQAVHTKTILKRLADLNVDDILWIGCDTWGTGLDYTFLKTEVPKIADNAILIAFESGLPRRFLQFLQSNNDILRDNPYVQEMVANIYDCSFTNDINLKNCYDIVNSTKVFEKLGEHGEKHVIDGVIALAHGVDILIKTYCPDEDLCIEAKSHMDELPTLMYNNKVFGIENDTLSFDSKGDGRNIFNFVQLRTSEKEVHKHIGSWIEGNVTMGSESLNIPHYVYSRNASTCGLQSCFSLPPNILDMKHVYIPGDIMIYVFLEVFRKTSESTECSQHLLDGNIFQAVSAILWSIQNSNRRGQDKMYPKIGVGIFSSCSHDSTMVKSVLYPSFVIAKYPELPADIPVLGLVGGAINPVAVSMDRGLKDLNLTIPLVISAETEYFNDRSKHPRVFRTVMPSTFEVTFSLQLAVKLKWKYIHIVNGIRDGDLIKLFESQAKKLGICLASKNAVDPDVPEDIDNAVDNMLKYEGAAGVFVFIPDAVIPDLLRRAEKKKTGGRLVFVVPKDITEYEHTILQYRNSVLGLILLQRNLTDNKQFKSYFESQTMNDDWVSQIPWAEQYWEDIHKCNLRYSRRYDVDCTSGLSMQNKNIQQPSIVKTLINGVYTLAKSYQSVLQKCNSTSYMTDCVKHNISEFYDRIEREMDNVEVTPDGGTTFSFVQRNATVPMMIKNLQLGPNGVPRYLTVGSYVKDVLTLDMRKLSMYKNGERLVFKSECPGKCSVCLDPGFLSSYNARVEYLSQLPPKAANDFYSAFGFITFVLVTIGILFSILASYYLFKYSSHKMFSLSADGHACIIIGTTVQICGAIVYLFDGSSLACEVHLALPGSVYSITLTGLLIKLNKTACLHAIVGTNITKLPRWDFAFTYLPIVISAPIIVYCAWTLEDPIDMTYSVPDVFSITNVDDVEVTWTCKFNRKEYIIFMSFFWMILLICMLLSIYYRCRQIDRREVWQVLYSAIVTSVSTITTTTIRLVSDDHVLFRTILSIFLPINGIVTLMINFLPQIIDLMREKNREMLFGKLMRNRETSYLADVWKDQISGGSNTSKWRLPKKVTGKEKSKEKTVEGLASKWKKSSVHYQTSEA